MVVADVLRPIPSTLLKDSAQILVCTGVDAWQNPTWQTYDVSNVHLQNTNEVKKTKDNTEVVLRSVLFIDCVRSVPQLNYNALVIQSEAAGRSMRAIVSDSLGNESGNFEIITVDLVPDIPSTRVHHIELGLV